MSYADIHIYISYQNISRSLSERYRLKMFYEHKKLPNTAIKDIGIFTARRVSAQRTFFMINSVCIEL